MCTEPARRAGGFSLLELIVFIVVVGVGLAGVVSVFTATATRSADPMLTRQALAIGEAFVEEILSREFDANASYAGGAVDPRSNFDDVSDYHGYAATGIRTRTNTAITGLTDYSVSVSVTPTAAAISSGSYAVPAGDMKLITVTVTDPTGASYQVSAYKARF